MTQRLRLWVEGSLAIGPYLIKNGRNKVMKPSAEGRRLNLLNHYLHLSLSSSSFCLGPDRPSGKLLSPGGGGKRAAGVHQYRVAVVLGAHITHPAVHVHILLHIADSHSSG